MQLLLSPVTATVTVTCYCHCYCRGYCHCYSHLLLSLLLSRVTFTVTVACYFYCHLFHVLLQLISYPLITFPWAGIAQSVKLDGPGIESRWGRDFPHPSRPALGPNQPPIQWLTYLFPGGKAAGAWCSPPTSTSAEAKVRVELHLYFSWVSSWPVLGWTFTFTFTKQTAISLVHSSNK
jgi:hypothetical protein